MSNRKEMIEVAVCLLAGIVLGLWLRGCTSKPSEPALREIHDTITIHDTLRIKEHTKPREVVRIDTIFLRGENDTIAVEVPITQSVYRDTFETDSSCIELGIEFSGWHAQIDGIDLKSRFSIQPAVVEKKRGFAWCVMPSVQVGYGVALGSPVVAAPYVGIGVSVGWGYYWKK